MTQVSLDEFQDRGYLALECVLEPDAVGEVRALLDPLFARFHELPPSAAQDLAGARGNQRPDPLMPEINRAVRFEPRLARTRVFATCRELARELVGRSAEYSFDHAIYKPPQNDTPTPWHQDQTYTGHRSSLGTVHFWIPLQDVTEENGCMHFVPGSHRLGLLRHSKKDRSTPTRTLLGADELAVHAIACPLAVGGLTVHTPFTVHYTGPNRTREPRRAWILHFGPFGRWAKLRPRVLAERMLGRLAPQD